MGLAGKTALVTGGTKGIGQAIADQLAQAGATVIVTARNPPGDTNPTHHFIAADLARAGQAAELVREIHDTVGQVDILINNAGGITSPGGGFSALTDTDWENELQLNLMAAIRLDRELLPGMLDRKSGVIIHISTSSGKQPLWDVNMAYATAKAALNCYSKALSNEVSGKGVRVLAVSPGAVKTLAVEQLVQSFAATAGISIEAASEGLMNKMGGIPIGRPADPEEIAAFVHFIVSPAASYLTGSNYFVDGGGLSGV